MKEIDRYLVTWGGNYFCEGFKLWRDAATWHTILSQEGIDAKMLYWSPELGEYKEASLPAVDLLRPSLVDTSSGAVIHSL